MSSGITGTTWGQLGNKRKKSICATGFMNANTYPFNINYTIGKKWTVSKQESFLFLTKNASTSRLPSTAPLPPFFFSFSWLPVLNDRLPAFGPHHYDAHTVFPTRRKRYGNSIGSTATIIYLPIFVFFFFPLSCLSFLCVWFSHELAMTETANESAEHELSPICRVQRLITSMIISS